ncbi:hypothetical protein AL479_13900 [Citrobacter amalonaticus]|nr:hypothetical protein AL479_13900 [Citrobacter amalonaticus]
MENMKKALCILLSVFISSSLLSGANVAFPNFWYSAPETFSKFILIITTMLFFSQWLLKLINKIR